MFQELTNEQIEKLAAGKGVRRVAVENFLGTLSGDRGADLRNQGLDSRLYRWNMQTCAAIRTGIKLAYAK